MREREEVLAGLPIGIESPGAVDGERTLECRRIAEHFDTARGEGAPAREEMFDVLRSRLLEVARRRLPADDAQDVVQESMLVVIDRIGECETPEALLGLAHGVLRNKIGNFYRKRDRQRRVVMATGSPPEESCTMDAELAGAELSRILHEAISELGKKLPLCRDILLGLAEGKSYSDLCRLLAIPSSIIEKRVFRSREALRKLIRDRQNGEGAGVLAQDESEPEPGE